MPVCFGGVGLLVDMNGNMGKREKVEEVSSIYALWNSFAQPTGDLSNEANHRHGRSRIGHFWLSV